MPAFPPPVAGGSGAVASVNTRTGAVVGLAEQSDLDALEVEVDANAAALTIQDETGDPLTDEMGDPYTIEDTYFALGGKVSKVGHTPGTISAAIGSTTLADEAPAAIKILLAMTSDDVAGLTAALAASAPLASPAFTGTPTAPDPTTAQGLATQAYVLATAALAADLTDEIADREAADALLVSLPSSPPAYTINGSAPAAGFTIPAAMGSFAGTLLPDAITAIGSIYARLDLLEGLIRGEVERDADIAIATI